MKKEIIRTVLKFIRNEAERGAGRPSAKGLFEQKVPRRFEERKEAKK